MAAPITSEGYKNSINAFPWLNYDDAMQRQARASKKELKNMFKDAAQRQNKQSNPYVSVTSLA